jgi:hypothetical protein
MYCVLPRSVPPWTKSTLFWKSGDWRKFFITLWPFGSFVKTPKVSEPITIFNGMTATGMVVVVLLFAGLAPTIV